MAEPASSYRWPTDTEPFADRPYSFASRLNMLFEAIRHPTERTSDGSHRKWKQKELAEAVGVHKAYISKLCIGGECNPGLELIRKISKFFNVSAAALVDDDPVAVEYITAQMNLYSALVNKDLDVAEIETMLNAPLADQPAALAQVLQAKHALDASRDHGRGHRSHEEGAVTGNATVLFRAPGSRDDGTMSV